MSLLTTIDVNRRIRTLEDLDELTAMVDWLKHHHTLGYTIINYCVMLQLEPPPPWLLPYRPGPPPLRWRYRGRLRFVDRNLALLFKLTWC